MALNDVYIEDYEVTDIITSNIESFLTDINNGKKDLGIICFDDINYVFLDRQEYISVNIEALKSFINTDEDIASYLPNRFGVYRGYAGGGIHSALQASETHQLDGVLTSEQLAEIKRLQESLKILFFKILKDLDNASGEEIQAWDSVTL